MLKCKRYKYLLACCMVVLFGACKVPSITEGNPGNKLPAQYGAESDSTNTAKVSWRSYFNDPYLVALIDTALKNNQELNITLQEIEIARNEIKARKGEYLPFVGVKAGAGFEKVGRYTSRGASEATTDIKPGKEMPEPLPDFMAGIAATWEVDIWHKLRNAKKAAVMRYLSTIEGKNFMLTNLVAEIANSYYELMALDSQLEIVRRNIAIQRDALEIVKLQKAASRATELAVRKFEAEVLNTQSIQYDILQQITETENRINFLLGRYPQPVLRSKTPLEQITPDLIRTGLPVQLLHNRPDIKQAQLELEAARFDLRSARAALYPTVGITATLGYQAFDPAYLLRTPASLLYGLAGDLAAPLVNRNALKAAFASANARQLQAVYHFGQTVLNAYMEVVNQLARIRNLEQSYALKEKQVQALTESISLSNDLFKSARADYMEVLLTQRDALEAKFELIETKKKQLNAAVDIYRALGGGWN